MRLRFPSRAVLVLCFSLLAGTSAGTGIADARSSDPGPGRVRLGVFLAPSLRGGDGGGDIFSPPSPSVYALRLDYTLASPATRRGGETLISVWGLRAERSVVRPSGGTFAGGFGNATTTEWNTAGVLTGEQRWRIGGGRGYVAAGGGASSKGVDSLSGQFLATGGVGAEFGRFYVEGRGLFFLRDRRSTFGFTLGRRL